MNMFKNLLFLHGYLVKPDVDDEIEFAQTYGNRVASEKSFGLAYGRHAANSAEHVDALCVQGGCG